MPVSLLALQKSRIPGIPVDTRPWHDVEHGRELFITQLPHLATVLSHTDGYGTFDVAVRKLDRRSF